MGGSGGRGEEGAVPWRPAVGGGLLAPGLLSTARGEGPGGVAWYRSEKSKFFQIFGKRLLLTRDNHANRQNRDFTNETRIQHGIHTYSRRGSGYR